MLRRPTRSGALDPGLTADLAIPAPEAMRGPAFWDQVQALVDRLIALSETGDW